MSKIFEKTAVVCFLVFLLASPFFVLAQEEGGNEEGVPEENQLLDVDTEINEVEFRPLEPVDELYKTEQGQGGPTVGPYLNNLYKFLVGIAAVLAVFMISLGGMIYITSDSWSGKDDGRKFINNALLGLLIVLSSWLILNIINPDLLDIDFDAGESKQEACESVEGIDCEPEEDDGGNENDNVNDPNPDKGA